MRDHRARDGIGDRRRLLGGAVATLGAGFAAATGLGALATLRGAKAQEPAPSLVATTSMIGDLARELSGDAFDVATLMGPGVDPHLFKATRSDLAQLLRADLVLYNGLFLEGKTIDALDRLRASGKSVVALAEAVDPALLLAPQGYEDQPDPHLWMDPAIWREVVAAATDAMARARPERAEAIAAAAERYRAEIAAFDDWATATLASVPEERRVLVTAHDAFGYFGRRFGFRVEGVQGVSTESEAGLRRIEELADFLSAERIPAVFVETSVGEQSLRALIAGAASRGWDVAIGGELFSDSMGAEGTYEGRYLGMLDHNVTTIARALGGEAPAGGYAGRLSAALESEGERP